MELYLHCGVILLKKEKYKFIIITLSVYQKRKNYIYGITFAHGEKRRTIVKNCANCTSSGEYTGVIHVTISSNICVQIQKS